MDELRWERWGAASGFAALLAGAVGGALEKGWPSATNPAAVATFLLEHRTAVLAQSMFFLLSSGIYLWFLGSLRSYLLRAEGGSGRLSTVVYGAGLAWVGLSMVAQSFQVGIALAAEAGVQPAMLWTAGAAFGVANLPCAVMLIAVAVLTFRHRAFPSWLGGITLAAAGAQLLLWFSTVVRSGPLAPTGWLMFVLYPLFLVWLVPTTVVMIRRLGSAPSGRTAVTTEA